MLVQARTRAGVCDTELARRSYGVALVSVDELESALSASLSLGSEPTHFARMASSTPSAASESSALRTASPKRDVVEGHGDTERNRRLELPGEVNGRHVADDVARDERVARRDCGPRRRARR